MFTSIDQVKVVAEKFEAGKIVPRRVLKCTPKKLSHLVVFLCDTYKLSGQNGVDVFFCDFTSKIKTRDETISYGPIRIKNANVKKLRLEGVVYGKSGNQFIGNNSQPDDFVLRFINQSVYGRKAVEL